MSESFVLEIPLNKITPNPLLLRRTFDKHQHLALTQSIKDQGVLHPIEVVANEECYVLVFGMRRVEAAKEAGFLTIPARVVPSPPDTLMVAVAENMLRADLNALEQAEAFDRMISEGVSQKEVSRISGLSGPSVCEVLKIMQIPIDIREECYKRGAVRKRFLIALSRYGHEEKIRDAFQYFLEEQKLPPRETRPYGIEGKNLKTLVTEIREVTKKLNECGAVYADEGPLQEELEREIAELITILANKGWYLPKRVEPSKFDTSNFGTDRHALIKDNDGGSTNN